MTEKDLISRIKTLKEIKPNKQWANFVLSKIVSNPKEEKIYSNGFISGVFKNVFDVLIQRKLAYSFALFAFIIVGVLSFAQYTVPGDTLFVIKRLAEHSQATLVGQTALNENIASLNNRINDLAQVSKQGKKENVPSVVNEIKENAIALQKSLNENQADKKDIKEIANTLKTLASVSETSGVDLKENQDLQDLYKTVVLNQINDLKSSTLTEQQVAALKEIEHLYETEDYILALEGILKINNKDNGSTDNGSDNK